ncbi:MAG TPA: cytochrome b5 domain-containing protein [Bacillota bacterium]|nr:cytochrome b5 domain-containing protein [Bacillota bacterium]
MIESGKSICQRMKQISEEAEKDIKTIFMQSCIYTRSSALYELGAKIVELEELCEGLIEYEDRQVQPTQLSITAEELSKYSGKNGMPAYVAVNGIVYNVTNNAAWAAATHFGLTAGKDLTGEFASCHAGQSILEKLMIVGKLI